MQTQWPLGVDPSRILPNLLAWTFRAATVSLESTLISIGIALLLLALLVIGVINFFGRFGRHGMIGHPSHYDAERLFTYEQKRRGHRRAGDRCEFEGVFIFRCHRQSSHADHYFAYSRGGATTMRNFVAACGTHNMRKGSKMPTALERIRLQRRRRRYFPTDELVDAGEWTSKIRLPIYGSTER